MRPETLLYKLNIAIQYRLDSGDSSKIRVLLKPMKKLWKKWAKEESDYRSGAETYGYNSIEEIYSDLCYISDRFRCAFRLKWLIDGVQNGSI